MKAEIHPEYSQATIQCTCGNVKQTRSTVADIRVGICSACHPFFTGEQRFVDTAGRVDKFSKRYGGSSAKRRSLKKPQLSDAE
ncbi:50S ribosomal protein L31 [Verrucomicrobiales bacterium]|nr:50S ribosomal protein L31 [Verrucomicrobiales bacterium]MDC0276573.1 50S ribosomal protein L31 [Verrucomicrobiales bacterium]MDC0314227.1 50S ribosomal protein L31 [bacterium]